MIEETTTCPKCDEDILFEMEWIIADDGQWWAAGLCAPEFQEFCKCSFTDEEIEALETKVANEFEYEPDCI